MKDGRFGLLELLAVAARALSRRRRFRLRRGQSTTGRLGQLARQSWTALAVARPYRASVGQFDVVDQLGDLPGERAQVKAAPRTGAN